MHGNKRIRIVLTAVSPLFALAAVSVCTLVPALPRAEPRALTWSEPPYRYRGTLTSALTVGQTTLPAGTEIFRTASKRDLLYRSPGMPAGQYLGISRSAFGRALARALATNDGARRTPGQQPADKQGVGFGAKSRWHGDVGRAVRLSNREVPGVENLSRLFGLPDSTAHGRVPAGLRERMVKTLSRPVASSFADGEVVGIGLGVGARSFSTDPGALRVETRTHQSVYSKRTGAILKARGSRILTSWSGDGTVSVDQSYTVGSAGAGTIKRLARALGFDVRAGDRLETSLRRSSSGALQLKVRSTAPGFDPVEKTYNIVQQSRGVLFDPASDG